MILSLLRKDVTLVMFFKLNFILFSLVFKRQHECLNASTAHVSTSAHSGGSAATASEVAQCISFVPRLRARSGSLGFKGSRAKWGGRGSYVTVVGANERSWRVERSFVEISLSFGREGRQNQRKRCSGAQFYSAEGIFTAKYHSQCIDKVWIQKNSSDLGHFILTSRW